jgi:hypothetical protein
MVTVEPFAPASLFEAIASFACVTLAYQISWYRRGVVLEQI